MAMRMVTAPWRRTPPGSRSGPAPRLMAGQGFAAGRAQPPAQLGDRMKLGVPGDDASTPATLAVPARRRLGGGRGIGGGGLGHDYSLWGRPAIVDGRARLPAQTTVELNYRQ